MRDASSVGEFCDLAIDAAKRLVDVLDRQGLVRGLDKIDSAASRLPSSKRENLLVETSKLRLEVMSGLSPEPGGCIQHQRCHREH